MPTKTDIANMALSYLGAQTVSNVETDPSDQAIYCRTNLQRCIDQVLQMRRWSCAMVQGELSELNETIPYKWTNVYQLPNDYIRLVEVAGVDAWNPEEWYQVQARQKLYIYGPSYSGTDGAVSPLPIEYIARPADTNTLSPLLVEAIAVRLASRIARQVTGSDTIPRALSQEFERMALPAAAASEANQRSRIVRNRVSRALRSSYLIRSRGQSWR